MAATDHPAELPLWPAGLPGALPPDRITDRENAVPGLTPFLLPAGGGRLGAAHPVVVVCPGGGYTHLAMAKEGYDVARWLNTLGISAVVLRYRLRDYGQPAPLRDVLQAVRTVRAKAAEWRVDPRRTGVMGFSAGGHLASCAGTLYDAPEGRTGGAYDAISARPDFLVLVYPVISMQEPWVHRGSRDSLLGPQPSPARVAEYSTDTQVTKDTPPTFLVHSSEDPVVPVENSVLFYSALRRAGVPAEMHLFRSGPHGFGLLPGHGPVSDWPRLCADWLRAGGWAGP
jgi:acetyl esterase/lipase